MTNRPIAGAAALCLTLGLAAAAVTARASTKDIVLDQVQAPLLAPVPNARPAADAMVVTVLLERPDGSLTPYGAAQPFRTGERFRVKVVTGRDGRIALYNTRPDGVTPSQPVWSGPIRAGQELLTQRLMISGVSGQDLLHVVLEPTQVEGVSASTGGASAAAAPASAASAPSAVAAGSGVWGWLRRVLGLNEKGLAEPGATKDIVLDTQSTPTGTYVSNPRGDGLTATITIQHSR